MLIMGQEIHGMILIIFWIPGQLWPLIFRRTRAKMALIEFAFDHKATMLCNLASLLPVLLASWPVARMTCSVKV